ncbi:hypothetical protein GPJ56_001168 [Histomonas meleagridis]|uniref:uncharacterized protein n=1 Tax=Histomonas meleagridis TaxID=135588 RepID=UPI0035593A00|nr:hypothetical protein GPJ56_001168 [Histomonas meleagridis]KAH0799869.1 hypothetical protein GO595_006981 [Histomonas meleagridis]
MTSSLLQIFVKPAYYVARPHPYPTFSYISLNATLPYISISVPSKSLDLKISGDPLKLQLSTNDPKTFSLKSKLTKVEALIKEQVYIDLSLTNFEIIKDIFTEISINNLKAEISSQILQYLSEWKSDLSLPSSSSSRSKIKHEKLPKFKSESQIMNYFQNPSFVLNIKSGLAKMHLIQNKEILFLINGLRYSLMKSKKQTKLHWVCFNMARLFTIGEYPLIKFEGGDIKTTSVISQSLILFKLNAFEINLKPVDFEFFIPEFSKYRNNSESNQNEGAPSKQPLQRHQKVTVDVKAAVLRLIQNESYVLVFSQINNVSGEMSKLPDSSSAINLIISSILIRNDHGTDDFKVILEKSQKTTNPFLKVCIQQAPRIMKAPVFEKVEFVFSPFILRLSLVFIKDLIKVFPSNDDLKLLLYFEDNEDEAPPSEEISLKQPEVVVGDSYFFREFAFVPFSALISVKRKNHGMFSEFRDRPFDYKGIHLYDTFGTPDRLSNFVKKHLIWAIIKAIPHALLRKKKSQGSNAGQDTDKETN